jgi:hypothetical protein
MGTPVGERFARAVAAKDASAHFPTMTPGEASSAGELVNEVP